MKRLIGIVLFCIFVFGGVAYADLTDGLIAYYPFNGNAHDESGNGNHGEPYFPTLTDDMFGNPECAYSFDGIDDHIRVPDSDSLDVTDGITIAAWVNINPHGGGRSQIVDSRDGAIHAPGYAMSIDTDIIGMSVPSGPGGFGVEVEPYVWHHVAGTYDGVTFIIYLDGEMVGNALLSTPFEQSTATLNIGTTYNGINHFDGIMDELRIYNRALSETEIEELILETGPPCDADYNDDGIVDWKDRINKRADLMREARQEFRDWLENCWLQEYTQ